MLGVENLRRFDSNQIYLIKFILLINVIKFVDIVGGPFSFY